MGTTWIASTELIAVAPDGKETRVTAAIGQPYQADRDEWRCAVQLSGLHEHLADMAGVDALQALCMGASLLRALLEAVEEEGGRVLSADDRCEYKVSAVFGRLGKAPRGAA